MNYEDVFVVDDEGAPAAEMDSSRGIGEDAGVTVGGESYVVGFVANGDVVDVVLQNERIAWQ